MAETVRSANRLNRRRRDVFILVLLAFGLAGCAGVGFAGPAPA